MGVPAANKKRSRDDATRARIARPSKKQKQRRRAEYHSDSDDLEGGDDFQAVNLLDSDEEDLENVQVDDVATSDSESRSGSDYDSASDRPASPARAKKSKTTPGSKSHTGEKARGAPSTDNPSGERGNGSDQDSLDPEDDDYDDELSLSADGEDEDANTTTASRQTKSKRNDPGAFASSLSKILSTKLSTSKRADPLLARSAAAHDASRQAQDAALETKARRRMREQKRAAMEKGRVRDVLVASAEGAGGEESTGGDGSAGPPREPTTTAELVQAERRLRKVAQRGVVKLFNAVRTAQVKAAEAERTTRSAGVTGVKRREEKVTEMSRKGFLDLIASGGGDLKKGGLEEA